VRVAREGRFTIHKTTRRIELSPLRAAAQLPVPFATGRAARICIIPFASTILIGGLFQSLSLRIFAFALLYLPRPPCPPLPSTAPSRAPLSTPHPPNPPGQPGRSVSAAEFPPCYRLVALLNFASVPLPLSVSSLHPTPLHPLSVTSFRRSFFIVAIFIASRESPMSNNQPSLLI